jgi:hypothetical protein
MKKIKDKRKKIKDIPIAVGRKKIKRDRSTRRMA